ncbi:MAG: MFS transporter [Alphaproteobacteria bacterium]|nr:MFS transporter [Alphaproteobacteria bacterium]
MEQARRRVDFLFLNLGHFFDHFLILIYATVAMAIAADRQVDIPGLTSDWDMTYADLVLFSTAGFVAFGLFSLPAGWLADRWSRTGMISVFFLGMGGAAILTSFAQTPWQLAAGILLTGALGAIYHPVGLAMVVQGREKTGVPLAINGVFGNLGVAAAPLCTLLLIGDFGWRAAFIVPGVACMLTGVAFIIWQRIGHAHDRREAAAGRAPRAEAAHVPALTLDRAVLIRVFAIIFVTAAIGSFIFQSTTFALPKIFDERLAGLATSGKAVGWWTFAVLASASLAQIVVGYLVDNHSVRVVFAAVAGLQAALFFAMLNLTGGAALLVAIGFMLVVFGQVPINDVLIGRIAKSEWRSRAYAIRYVVSFAVMATTIPTIAVVHGNWGFDGLFLIMAGGASLIFLAVVQLPGTRLRVSPATAE